MIIRGEEGDCFWIKDEIVPESLLEMIEVLTENEDEQNEEAEGAKHDKTDTLTIV